MKRYIIISTLVHLLCFYLIFLQIEKKSSNNAQGVEQTTIELVEAKPTGDEGDAKNGGSGRDVEIIELSPTGEGESKALNTFYWGVGISGDYVILEIGQVYRINTVFGGYSADSAGLLPGDLIYSVNGGSVVLNDISGEGPAHLILGIIRGSNKIFINLDRVQVYY